MNIAPDINQFIALTDFKTNKEAAKMLGAGIARHILRDAADPMASWKDAFEQVSLNASHKGASPEQVSMMVANIGLGAIKLAASDQDITAVIDSITRFNLNQAGIAPKPDAKHDAKAEAKPVARSVLVVPEQYHDIHTLIQASLASYKEKTDIHFEQLGVAISGKITGLHNKDQRATWDFVYKVFDNVFHGDKHQKKKVILSVCSGASNTLMDSTARDALLDGISGFSSVSGYYKPINHNPTPGTKPGM